MAGYKNNPQRICTILQKDILAFITIHFTRCYTDSKHIIPHIIFLHKQGRVILFTPFMEIMEENVLVYCGGYSHILAFLDGLIEWMRVE